MLTRDHIMRQVQQLAQVLARVFSLKAAQQHVEAMQVIDQTLQELFAVQERDLARLSCDALLDRCRGEEGLSWQKALGLADLLRERGDLLLRQGRPAAARPWLERALGLYEAAVRADAAPLPWDLPARLALLRQQRDEAGGA